MLPEVPESCGKRKYKMSYWKPRNVIAHDTPVENVAREEVTLGVPIMTLQKSKTLSEHSTSHRKTLYY